MSQSEKIKGIVLLGLVKSNQLLMRLIFYKCSGYEVWTLNDFWMPYPGLKPDRAYQLHKDVNPHVDELGNQRDCSDYIQECQERKVKTIIHDLSISDYMRYYGQQPEEWYQSSINYMFVDAWQEIENGRSEPNIIVEGMPFTGSGERDRQLPFVKSAVKMSVNRGITVQISTLEEWDSNTNAISWKNIAPGVVTYALTQQDYGVYQERVSNKIKEASRKIINMNLDAYHAPRYEMIPFNTIEGKGLTEILIVGRGSSATKANIKKLRKFNIACFCNGAVDLAEEVNASIKIYCQYDGPTHPNPSFRLSPVDFASMPDCIDMAVVPIREKQSYTDNHDERLRFFNFMGITKNSKPVPTAFMAILFCSFYYQNPTFITIGMDSYRQTPNAEYSHECKGPRTLDVDGQKAQVVERMPDGIIDNIKHFDGEPFVL